MIYVKHTHIINVDVEIILIGTQASVFTWSLLLLLLFNDM
jgi:hypothetical protein